MWGEPHVPDLLSANTRAEAGRLHSNTKPFPGLLVPSTTRRSFLFSGVHVPPAFARLTLPG